MKALIDTKCIFTWSWISSWTWVPATQTSMAHWEPTYSEILDCQRVSQIEPDDKTFPVYHTLFWVDCPDNCVADQWYFKDGACNPKPQDVPMPAAPVETLP